jgi:hypothetical protein
VIENGIIVVHPPVNSTNFNAEGGGVRRNQADVVILAEGIDAEKNEEKRPGWTFPPEPASK